LVQDTVVCDGVQSTATGFLGDSNFSAAGTKFHGFITLASTDGSDVTIERGNLQVASTGTDADLEDLGFNQVSRIAEGDKYSITGKALTATNEDAPFAVGDIKINGVDVYDANINTQGIAGKIDAINAKSAETGVVASAYYENIIDLSGGGIDNGDTYEINGIAVATVGTTVASLATAINGKTSDHGITAEASGTNLILKGTNVTNVVIDVHDGSDSTAALGATEVGYFEAAQFTRIRLDSVDNTPIRIELGEGAAVGEHGFVETNIGASDFDVNEALFSAGAAGGASGLSVKTTADASSALSMLDKAISSVSDIRSDLGALQNRLDHTINNLSSVSNNTESAKSRIMDTDFATETANLTKQQILSQAATSMLAQANQSKQGILALLQG
jgi:flagellin